MTARQQHAVEQVQVTDPPVRGQMMQAARVVDQAVPAARHPAGENVAAVEPDVQPGRAGPLIRCRPTGVAAEVAGEEAEGAVYLEARHLTVLAGVGVQRLLG
jgi:hypothetical protein